MARHIPTARDTTETEIGAARTPPDLLAAELAQYARLLKLPANMDLFLVGDFDTDQIKEMVRKSFSRFPFAEGPRLEVPQVGITRSHKSLNAVSKELKRPLSEILIAWNTGVGVTNPQARTLLALGEYINKVLFSQLREKFGDTYYAGSLIQGRQLLRDIRDQDLEQQQSRGGRAQDHRGASHTERLD